MFIVYILSIVIGLSGAIIPLTRGVVSLTFDDGLYEHYLIASVLKDKNIKATFYINSGRFGDNRITAVQVQNISYMGHEIGGHTMNHVRLSDLSQSGQIKEICNDKRNLENLGLNVTSFAYPFGLNPPGIENTVKNCGYSSARDSGGLRFGNGCETCPYAISLNNIDNIYALRSISIRNTMTIADLQSMVLNANAAKGGTTNVAKGDVSWLILIFHEIVDDSSQYPTGIETPLLVQFIDWLSNQDVSIKTIRQVILNETDEMYENNDSTNKDPTHNGSAPSTGDIEKRPYIIVLIVLSCMALSSPVVIVIIRHYRRLITNDIEKQFDANTFSLTSVKTSVVTTDIEKQFDANTFTLPSVTDSLDREFENSKISFP